MSSSAGSQPPGVGQQQQLLISLDILAEHGRNEFLSSIHIILNSPSRIKWFLNLYFEFTNLSFLAVEAIYLHLIQTTPGKLPIFILVFFLLCFLLSPFRCSKVQLSILLGVFVLGIRIVLFCY